MRCWLLLLVFIPLSYSFVCHVCDGEDCASPERWLLQTCPSDTRLCYRLTANGKVFRRGCAPMDCDEMRGIPASATCNSCDSDKCNGNKRIQLDRPGGGDVWGPYSNSALNLILTGLTIIVLTSI